MRSFKRSVLPISIAIVFVAGIVLVAARMLHGSTPIDNDLLVSGNIETHESELSFQMVQSRITELPFDEGAWVRAGELLARVDDSSYRQQVAIDQAMLEVQQQQLLSAQENFQAAQATVMNDQAAASQRETDFDRYQTLWSKNAVSEDTRDQAQTAFQQAHANVLRDQALLRVSEKEVGVAAANVKSAEENLKMSQITLDFTTLRAPFSGVLLARESELGEVVQPGSTVVTVGDLDHVWLRGYVDEIDLGRIRFGSPAAITTDSYPGKHYAGRVSFISSEAEFTPKSVETHKERVTLVYRVKIDVVDNPQHELKPGMPADAHL
jgi:HlyD family secretion protein